jgi:hypothetical protein
VNDAGQASRAWVDHPDASGSNKRTEAQYIPPLA